MRIGERRDDIPEEGEVQEWPGPLFFPRGLLPDSQECNHFLFGDVSCITWFVEGLHVSLRSCALGCVFPRRKLVVPHPGIRETAGLVVGPIPFRVCLF